MNKTRWVCRALFWTACLGFPAALSAQGAGVTTLKQAVNLALQNSRDVALAQANHTVAVNAAGVNRSAFRPNLYTGSGAGVSYGMPQTLAGSAPSIANLAFVQTIFNTQLRGQTQEAVERAEIQRLEVERTRNSVAYQTASAYLELAKVRHSLDRLQEQRQSTSRILDFTRNRRSEGVELPVAVSRAELDVAKIDRDIISLEGRQHVLEAQLAALIGAPATRVIQLESEGLRLAQPASEEELVQRALETNQELLEAEHERRAKQRRVAGEDGAKWGNLDLGAGYQVLSKSNNYDEFFNKFQRNNVSVGVQYRLPIFSSDRSARVALARSELSVAEIQLKNKRENLELQIKQQYQHVRELDAARTVARLEQTVAQEDLQVVQTTFQEGRSNLRDVERVRVQENASWIAFLDADYELQKAQLELLNITGELSSLFEQKP